MIIQVMSKTKVIQSDQRPVCSSPFALYLIQVYQRSLLSSCIHSKKTCGSNVSLKTMQLMEEKSIDQ